MAKTKGIHSCILPSIPLLSAVASLILSLLQDIDIIHLLRPRGNLEQLVNVMGICVRTVGRKQNMGYIWQLPVLASFLDLKEPHEEAFFGVPAFAEDELSVTNINY